MVIAQAFDQMFTLDWRVGGSTLGFYIVSCFFLTQESISKGFIIQKQVKVNAAKNWHNKNKNWHHLSMSNQTQFDLNYLHDSALIIYVNLQLLFMTVYSNHFWTWKWGHDGTETLSDFTSIDFYKKRNSTLSLPTQVYKWVPANCWGILTGKPGGNPALD